MQRSPCHAQPWGQDACETHQFSPIFGFVFSSFGRNFVSHGAQLFFCWANPRTRNPVRRCCVTFAATPHTFLQPTRIWTPLFILFAFVKIIVPTTRHVQASFLA